MGGCGEGTNHIDVLKSSGNSTFSLSSKSWKYIFTTRFASGFTAFSLPPSALCVSFRDKLNSAKISFLGEKRSCWVGRYATLETRGDAAATLNFVDFEESWLSAESIKLSSQRSTKWTPRVVEFLIVFLCLRAPKPLALKSWMKKVNKLNCKRRRSSDNQNTLSNDNNSMRGVFFSFGICRGIEKSIAVSAPLFRAMNGAAIKTFSLSSVLARFSSRQEEEKTFPLFSLCR